MNFYTTDVVIVIGFLLIYFIISTAWDLVDAFYNRIIKDNQRNYNNIFSISMILRYLLLILGVYILFLSHPPPVLHGFDPYQILDILPSATNKEIKNAYRKLSFKHHPDWYLDLTKEEQELASNKYIEIAMAYEILTDDEANTNFYNHGHPNHIRPSHFEIALNIFRGYKYYFLLLWVLLSIAFIYKTKAKGSMVKLD